MLQVPIRGSVLLSAVLAPISKIFGVVIFHGNGCAQPQKYFERKVLSSSHSIYICNLLCASEPQMEEQLFGSSVSLPAGLCAPYRDLHAQGRGIKLCSLTRMTLAKISVLSTYKHPHLLQKRFTAQSTGQLCCFTAIPLV